MANKNEGGGSGPIDPAPEIRNVENATGILELMRAEHLSVFGPDACPQWVKDSLSNYEKVGLPTGDFLRAVLANDLFGACGRADINSARCIAAIVSYIYNELPGNIHGSYEIVDGWVSHCLEARRAAMSDTPIGGDA